MGKPHLYPVIPGLSLETQLYTQRRSNAESPLNYRFTMSELLDFLKNQGVVIPFSTNEYPNDAEAIAAGASAGDWYFLSQANDYGQTYGNGGFLKQVQ